MTTASHTATGRDVHYTGDAANFPRDGYVAEISADEWGVWAVIAWDDLDGPAVSRVPAHNIVEPANAKPGDRFIFA